MIKRTETETDRLRQRQLTLLEEYELRISEVQTLWGQWRDAQCLDSVHRQLVDDVFHEYLEVLEESADSLRPLHQANIPF